MTRNDPLAATFAFEDFELDWPSRELRKRGKRLRVAQQPLHALVLLVNAGGTLVTREELRRALWQGSTFVDFDRAINKAINQLRQLLGDSVERPRFIQTVPRCGYRFVAPVARGPFLPTQNPQVREPLLKARYFWNKRTGEGVARSVEYFRQVIEQDATCVDAWAGLAQARATLGVFGLQPPHEAFRSARAAAERALALNDAAAEAHIALGDVYRFFRMGLEGGGRVVPSRDRPRSGTRGGPSVLRDPPGCSRPACGTSRANQHGVSSGKADLRDHGF